MKLGVCYYPEHWHPEQWAVDAAHMHTLGIRVVRIGEFAWSRIEPRRGDFNFGWLHTAMDTLADAGLQIVLGTPTATPPKWLIDEHPEILACDEQGQVRGFGSRRHYCFSSQVYRAECQRIVTELASRFSQNPGLIAWQTDNEYGCHDTALSYSAAAKSAFQHWCQRRYKTIKQLNAAWGNVFWSMEYPDFAAIELPVGSVTESNPAHRLAFWRFSSDQIQSFNQLQFDILKSHSPELDVTHNFMGNFVEFDHYQLRDSIDVATWDNYPLGFLDRDDYSAADRQTWLRTGHPDSSAFHHDLYRGVGKGRWWIMEQQPGPVNWAAHNPAPLEGMLRLWAWEGFAHGAEVVSWFRWRQLPFAQEQLHAGLCLPDGEADTGAVEVATVFEEQQSLPVDCQRAISQATRAAVAILFDYTSDRVQRILRIGGSAHDPLTQTRALYSACRSQGVNVDIVPADADLSGYRLILIPAMTINSPLLATYLRTLLDRENPTVVLFPGTASRNSEAAIEQTLGPADFRSLIDVTITRSESLPASIVMPITTDEGNWRTRHWRERIESDLTPAAQFEDGWGFHYRQGKVHYLNAQLDYPSACEFIQKRLIEEGVTTLPCAAGLRLRHCGGYTFAFNFGPSRESLSAFGVSDAHLLLGRVQLNAGELALWKNAGLDCTVPGNP